MEKEENNLEKTKMKNLNGTVEVKKGKIIVKNPMGYGEYARVIPDSNGKLYINRKEVMETSIVKEEDEIIFTREGINGKRSININTNEHNTEARISIDYEAGLKYEIKDKVRDYALKLELNEVQGELPPLFTSKNIIEYLNTNGIIFGLEREAIKLVEESRDIKDLCVARGLPVEETFQDELKVVFKTKKWNKTIDTMENIDYKNIISIESVKKGDIIAEIIRGRMGKDGVSIYNKKINATSYKEKNFRIGIGCKMEENKIIATIDGKPSIRNNIFNVNKLYTVNGDVDIKSRNIIFIGDVHVQGKVTEGMSIIANSVNILGGSFKSNIKVNNSSLILGNIVNSEIKIGGQDLVRQKKIQEFLLLKEQLEALLENINFLKEKKLIDENVVYGNLIKTLIESKYKTIPKNCIAIIGLELSSSDPKTKLISIFKQKLIGRGPLNIKTYSEIKDIIEMLNIEIELLELENSLSSDLTIEYCQESNIEVLGNVLVVGRGSYTSEIFAMENIEFTQKDSVCRGGHLKADKFIKVKTVGSIAGVETKLEVDKDGHIYADIAYQNTMFIIGKSKYILLKHSKDVHAYRDKKGELIIDKLNL